MELVYAYQATVRNTIITLWYYYIYIFAPRMVNNLLSAIVLVLLCGRMSDEFDLLVLWSAAVLFFLSVVEFPLFCYRWIKTSRSCRAFDGVTEIKLTNESLFVQRGEDSGNSSLRSLSGYFIYKKRLFLLYGGRALMCAIKLDEIPSGEETARAIMKKSPVQKLNFISFRRWSFSIILLIIAALIIYVQYFWSVE